MVAIGDSSLNQISLEYSYAELQQATRNFDPALRLGHGSFGGVFRGIQRDGTECAIKVLDLPEEGGFEEEVRVLSKFRHPNLVILMGFARLDDQRFLVYELLEGGDVFKRLQRSCVDNVPFLWRARVSAAFDAACGLSHLHHATPKVFHRDIKSPNILLDRNGTAKMADFGLACLSHASEHRVEQASGTVGYACPLYVKRGVVTEGSEVYSFGIVLLELLTAAAPAYLAQAADGSQQYQFLAMHIGGDARVAVSLADVKAQWQQQVCCSVADLALRCIQGAEELRPTFTDVVNVLRILRDVPEQPSPPLAAAQQGAASPVVAAGARWAPPAQPQLQAGQPLLQAGQPLMQAPQPQVQAPQPHLQAQQQQLQAMQAQLQAPHPQVQVPQPQLQAQQPQLQAPQLAPGALQAMGFQGNPALGGVVTPAAPMVAGSPAPQVQSPPQNAVGLGMPGIVHQQQHQQGLVVQQFGPVLGGSPIARQPAAVRPPPQLVLWTLECVHSEGCALGNLSRERRSLVHCQEQGGPLLTTLRVGRLFQEDFFHAIIQEDETRAAVSREHFQIWADEVQLDASTGASPFAGLPCLFFLTNYSVNGTVVNGRHLQHRGDQIPLHSGDTIAFARVAAGTEGLVVAPFLEFRFDLTGSVLGDAADILAIEEAPPPQAATALPAWGRTIGAAAAALPLVTVAALPAAAPIRALGGTPGIMTPPAAAALATRQAGTGPLAYDASGDGSTFLNFVGVAFFALEVGGTALREGVPAGQRRILHGPATAQEPCPPLLLGRNQQPVFWQRLLIEEAFSSLSRQHLQIEVCEEGCSGGPTIFHVRNLSERNPIRVSSSLEDGAVDAARPLERDQRRLLNHGDVIFVNPNKGSTLWLVFRDLVAGRLRQPPLAVMAGSLPAVGCEA